MAAEQIPVVDDCVKVLEGAVGCVNPAPAEIDSWNRVEAGRTPDQAFLGGAWFETAREAVAAAAATLTSPALAAAAAAGRRSPPALEANVLRFKWERFGESWMALKRASTSEANAEASGEPREHRIPQLMAAARGALYDFRADLEIAHQSLCALRTELEKPEAPHDTTIASMKAFDDFVLLAGPNLSRSCSALVAGIVFVEGGRCRNLVLSVALGPFDEVDDVGSRIVDLLGFRAFRGIVGPEHVAALLRDIRDGRIEASHLPEGFELAVELIRI